ncbi:SDR family oxidoreductase [Rubritalea profundi]|uniref:Gluconate 5-dehydrogenase n=1 Tax=Rubritalea profundi TaxID=1658618 RepID=A0A2S7TZV5_9BACT|nr:SDR family oxidoreductase [Rubritalea profundi]PQJ28276.1 gluconate 5-dehydrogenase [Rubritalea profundi]
MHFLENLFNLHGQVAVIIGGTGELCGHMALGLAQAGANVVLVGRSEAKAKDRIQQIEAAGGSAYFVAADVADKASIQQVLDSVLERSGRVDILINGAGINSPTPVLEITTEEFNNILNINLTATLHGCQVFAKHWLDNEQQGSIINLGSISGLNPLSRVFSYSASKAAVHNLSKNLAREWADQGIRVNTLVPGFFPAEQNKAVLNPSRVESIMQHTPMDRFGSPDELTGATILLASNKAGSFITGHEMVVDGGFDSMSI